MSFGIPQVKRDKTAGPFGRTLQHALSIFQVKLDKTGGPFRRALQYAFHDWTEDMTWPRRLLTLVGLLIQVAALGLAFALMEPKKLPFVFLALLIYTIGLCLMNGMLTSEFVRKTQLEADQVAAEQIQQTLHPQKVEELPGYQMEMFYKPLRGVGGDYFDVIALPDGQTLFAVADVSGKGMPAALLAANVQALVRSISNVASDPLSVANHVNNHLCRYTPTERFATAVFALLSHETGELTYVNAGQNSPILSSLGRTTFLESTGVPLGLLRDAQFQCKRVTIPHGGRLLFFTDGLTDGIGGQRPEERVCAAIASDSMRAMSSLTSLLNPQFNEDDVTILLLTRLDG
jgi:serine phosphatase RsbU (regulator of sigma subunit)